MILHDEGRKKKCSYNYKDQSFLAVFFLNTKLIAAMDNL